MLSINIMILNNQTIKESEILKLLKDESRTVENITNLNIKLSSYCESIDQIKKENDKILELINEFNNNINLTHCLKIIKQSDIISHQSYKNKFNSHYCNAIYMYYLLNYFLYQLEYKYNNLAINNPAIKSAIKVLHNNMKSINEYVYDTNIFKQFVPRNVQTIQIDENTKETVIITTIDNKFIYKYEDEYRIHSEGAIKIYNTLPYIYYLFKKILRNIEYIKKGEYSTEVFKSPFAENEDIYSSVNFKYDEIFLFLHDLLINLKYVFLDEFQRTVKAIVKKQQFHIEILNDYSQNNEKGKAYIIPMNTEKLLRIVEKTIDHCKTLYKITNNQNNKYVIETFINILINIKKEKDKLIQELIETQQKKPSSMDETLKKTY